MVENYSIFGKSLKTYELGMHTGNSTVLQGSNSLEFVSNLKSAFRNSHLYQVEESTKRLLMLTKTPDNTDIRHIPFSNMFIDVSFTREEIQKFCNLTIEFDRIVGMIVQEGNTRAIDKDGKYIDMNTGDVIRVIVLGVNDEKQEMFFNTFHISIKLDEEFKDWKVHNESDNRTRNTKKFAKMFSINFVNLILDPEIVLVQRDANREQNEKRIKRGQVPIPASTSVRLDGERKIYIDRMVSNGCFNYGYRFWVQGHYRTLRAERYKESRNKKIWVAPFVKGEGILVEKTYKVKR